jgi:hypothetical protein
MIKDNLGGNSIPCGLMGLALCGFGPPYCGKKGEVGLYDDGVPAEGIDVWGE